MDKKAIWKYSKVAIILGCVAAGSGLLIGATNLLTSDRIAENKIVATQKSLSKIYGKDVDYVEVPLKDTATDKYDYVNGYYRVEKDGVIVGNVFTTAGKNSYGTIELAVGINLDETIGKISPIILEQSFAGTIQDNYLDPYNVGAITIDNVKCGATVGASLIASMAKESLVYYQEVVKNMPVDSVYYAKQIYPNASFEDEVKVNGVDDIIGYMEAKENDKTIGYVFYADKIEETQYGKKRIMPFFGINVDGSLGKIVLAKNQNHYSIQTDYIDKVNNGTISYDETANCGATQTANKLAKIFNDAIAYFNTNLKEGK